MKWKVLSSKYLAKDPPWFQVRVEKVQLPSKEILENYYVLEYPNWVTVLAITPESKVVMIKQYRHAISEVAIEIPAGVIDDEDESPLDAAKRELLEETGYGNGEWEFYMKTSPNPGTHTNYCFTFIARNVEYIQEQTLDRTEDIEVKLYELQEVRQMLENNEIIQAMHAAPLWKHICQVTENN